ncbi:hypothetical protein FALBO_2445 [Fusarium albosuccineum]|uniref:Uncharacterized protein n=1 Tax=Fusarium albosuccineum TaxID=1237068 RepID=A0A8H4PFG6_9HYPO|nr:hypothetical protein FALBO_2445 [Fusarium albosuccineum]
MAKSSQVVSSVTLDSSREKSPKLQITDRNPEAELSLTWRLLVRNYLTLLLCTHSHVVCTSSFLTSAALCLVLIIIIIIIIIIIMALTMPLGTLTGGERSISAPPQPRRALPSLPIRRLCCFLTGVSGDRVSRRRRVKLLPRLSGPDILTASVLDESTTPRAITYSPQPSFRDNGRRDGKWHLPPHPVRPHSEMQAIPIREAPVGEASTSWTMDPQSPSGSPTRMRQRPKPETGSPKRPPAAMMPTTAASDGRSRGIPSPRFMGSAHRDRVASPPAAMPPARD